MSDSVKDVSHGASSATDIDADSVAELRAAEALEQEAQSEGSDGQAATGEQGKVKMMLSILKQYVFLVTRAI